MFKLPADVHKLLGDPLRNVDDLQNGDFLLIPTPKDEPRLNLSVSTLRKCGLSISTSTSHDSNALIGYVVGIFGDKTRTRPILMKIFDVSRDLNPIYGNSSDTLSVDYDDPNSITGKVITKKPVCPLIVCRAHRFSISQSIAGYPRFFGATSQEPAMQLLLNTLGEQVLPVPDASYREHHETEEVKASAHDLPYGVLMRLMSLLADDVICKRYGVDLDYISGSYKYRNTRASDRFTMSNYLMTGLEGKSVSTYAERYMPSTGTPDRTERMTLPRTFLEEILRRGATLYHSPALQDLENRVYANEVARAMCTRYGDILRVVQGVLKDSAAELRKLRKTTKAFARAAHKLELPPALDDVVSLLRS